MTGRTVAKLVVVSALLVVSGYFGFYKFYGEGRVTKADAFTLKAAPADLVLAVVGRVRSQEVVNIHSVRSGAITEMMHDEGDSVKKGEPLTQIRAEAEQVNITISQAQLDALAASAKLARQKLDRVIILAERGFVAQVALDEAKASLATIHANQSAAKAALSQARVRVREFTVLAPMDGIILSRSLDEGQVVGTNDVIFQIGSEGLIEIEAEVDEYYAERLTIGMKALLSPSGSKALFDGQIYQIAPRVDPLTGGRIVRLLPELNSAELLPGRSVDVNIIAEHYDQALSVPRRALLKQDQMWMVYMVQNERAVARAVEFVDWPGRFVIVTSGLQANDVIVLDPMRISNDMKLKIVDDETSTEDE